MTTTISLQLILIIMIIVMTYVYINVTKLLCEVKWKSDGYRTSMTYFKAVILSKYLFLVAIFNKNLFVCHHFCLGILHYHPHVLNAGGKTFSLSTYMLFINDHYHHITD